MHDDIKEDIKEEEEPSDKQPLIKKSEKFFMLQGIKIDLKFREKFYKTELIE